MTSLWKWSLGRRRRCFCTYDLLKQKGRVLGVIRSLGVFTADIRARLPTYLARRRWFVCICRFVAFSVMKRPARVKRSQSNFQRLLCPMLVAPRNKRMCSVRSHLLWAESQELIWRKSFRCLSVCIPCYVSFAALQVLIQFRHGLLE